MDGNSEKGNLVNFFLLLHRIIHIGVDTISIFLFFIWIYLVRLIRARAG